MHERTQRAMAQLLFVGCCALPTFLTMSAIVVTRSPWYHQSTIGSWEADLSVRTATRVHIESMERRSPTASRLGGLTLNERESDKEIVRVSVVDWRRTDEETALVLHQPEFRAAQMGAAWQLFHDRFLKNPDLTDRPFHFAANDLTIHSGAESMTMRDVDATVETNDDAVTANFQAVLAASEESSPILVSVTRDRTGAIPTTVWTLTTGSTALPCSAFADLFPDQLESLGPSATFTGTMRFAVNQDGWTLDLGGAHFEKVSLDRLFQGQSYRLSGTATIDLQHGLIQPGKRLKWLGTVHAQDGIIGQALLNSMNESLGVEIAQFDGPGDVPYDQLALQFDLSDTRMTLQGICDTVPGYGHLPPYILVCQRESLIAACKPIEMPALVLASVMSSGSPVTVGVTGQNQRLLSWMVPPKASFRSVPPFSPVPPDSPKIRTATRIDGDQPLVQPR